MSNLAMMTHGVALMLGWGLMVLFGDDGKDDAGQQRASDEGRANQISRTAAIGVTSPRSLLMALAHTPMEQYDRMSLKSDIYSGWAEEDPVGLLHYLEGRFFEGSGAFAELARTRPELLLEYAKRHGSGAAMMSLMTNGDSETVLELVLLEQSDCFSGGMIASLFASGMREDPKFHKNLGRLDNSEHLASAVRAVCTMMLEVGDYDSYFGQLDRFGEVVDPEDAVKELTRHILSREKDVEILREVPEQFRERAVETLLGELVGHQEDQVYQRRALSSYLEQGWLDGSMELAEMLIRRGYDNAYGRKAEQYQKEALAWKDWALQLPGEDRLVPVLHAAIRRWILTDPEQWQAISALPTVALRDVAYTAALSGIGKDLPRGTIEWIGGQVVDAELGEVARHLLDQRLRARLNDNGEGGDRFPIDPFADSYHFGSIDPFDPLAEPEEAIADPFAED